jgi:hypothetical protein
VATDVAPHRSGVAQARRQRGRRVLTAALSVAGHLAILSGLASAFFTPPKPFEPEPMRVELVNLRPAADRPAPPAPAPPSPAKPPPRAVARPTRVLTAAIPLPAGDTPSMESGVSDGQLASAAVAGSGPPGGACDMARRLQTALRKDHLVQAALAEASRGPGAAGKAMLVWNGDWIRSRGQDGNGLAAVREAMMWEIAFAPEACRAEAVHGLVLFSLNDGAGRLVVGAGDWRWSDLLGPRRGASGDSLSRR